MAKKNFISMIVGTAMVMGVLVGCSSSGAAETTATETEATAETDATVNSDADDAATNTETAETNATASETAVADNTDAATEGKTLVVYYSAQGHTVNFAEAIAEELDADLFEITPVEAYSEADLDWTDGDSRVSKEHDDESLRDIELVTTDVENWESYDTVYIGYPIWWGIAAWPVDNFVKDNDFTGKTVIPFATSSSSGLGESGEILEEYAGSGTWLEGMRFQSNEDVENAREWAAQN